MRYFLAATLMIMFLLHCISSNIFGQDITLTTKLKPKYLGINGSIFYDKPILQTFVDFNWKNGVYAEIWTATNNKKEWDPSKELDLQLGKSGKIGRYNYSADINYFVIIITDVANLNLELNRDYRLNDRTVISPFIRGEWYVPTHKNGPRRGVMGIMGAKTSFKLSPYLEVSNKLSIRKDSGCFGFNPALIGQDSLALNLKIKKANIFSGINFSQPISMVNDARKREIVPEMGISFRF